MPSLNVKDYLLAGACVLALLFALAAGVQTWRADRLKGDLETAEAQKLGAQIQATLSDKVRTITETLHTRETIIREKADVAADEIARRPDGADPLPAGLAAHHLGAIRMLRGAEAQPSNPGSGDPAGGVSAPSGGGDRDDG